MESEAPRHASQCEDPIRLALIRLQIRSRAGRPGGFCTLRGGVDREEQDERRSTVSERVAPVAAENHTERLRFDLAGRLDAAFGIRALDEFTSWK